MSACKILQIIYLTCVLVINILLWTFFKVSGVKQYWNAVITIITTKFNNLNCIIYIVMVGTVETTKLSKTDADIIVLGYFPVYIIIGIK